MSTAPRPTEAQIIGTVTERISGTTITWTPDAGAWYPIRRRNTKSITIANGRWWTVPKSQIAATR